jgi:cell wall-associated NlpC family hydrolase
MGADMKYTRVRAVTCALTASVLLLGSAAHANASSVSFDLPAAGVGLVLDEGSSLSSVQEEAKQSEKAAETVAQAQETPVVTTQDIESGVTGAGESVIDVNVVDHVQEQQVEEAISNGVGVASVLSTEPASEPVKENDTVPLSAGEEAAVSVQPSLADIGVRTSENTIVEPVDLKETQTVNDTERMTESAVEVAAADQTTSEQGDESKEASTAGEKNSQEEPEVEESSSSESSTETSSTTESSSAAETPSTPESSSVAETPSTPESSSAAETPSTPESSSVAETPSTPESSSAAETPSVPESSSESESSASETVTQLPAESTQTESQTQTTPTESASETASQTQATETASAETPSAASAEASHTVENSVGSDVAEFAVQFVGNPYVYGGTSLTNGADCSGFVMSVYENFGVSLPHSSSADRNVGVDVGGLENAQPGDIVCYSGHVGIYIGNNQIVHASTASTGIKISDADYRTPVAVRRIFE